MHACSRACAILCYDRCRGGRLRGGDRPPFLFLLLFQFDTCVTNKGSRGVRSARSQLLLHLAATGDNVLDERSYTPTLFCVRLLVSRWLVSRWLVSRWLVSRWLGYCGPSIVSQYAARDTQVASPHIQFCVFSSFVWQLLRRRTWRSLDYPGDRAVDLRGVPFIL